MSNDDASRLASELGAERRGQLEGVLELSSRLLSLPPILDGSDPSIQWT